MARIMNDGVMPEADELIQLNPPPCDTNNQFYLSYYGAIYSHTVQSIRLYSPRKKEKKKKENKGFYQKVLAYPPKLQF